MKTRTKDAVFLSFCALLLAGAPRKGGGCLAEEIRRHPVTAVFPERWTPPQDRRGAIDFALSAQADAWLYVEALSGAGVTMRDWDVIESPTFRFGVGALRKAPGDRAKWNFRGRGFQLWSPRGPAFGGCELLLDGRKLADLHLHADGEQSSRVVYRCDEAGDGYHAVTLRSTGGRLVVDSLDVLH